jgi:hypothetical protein
VLYHYTIAAHAESILRDGVIRPATTYVPKGERPIVWFSANATWEETANKMGCHSRNETERKWGPLYRFGVASETAPHNFERLVFLAHINPRMSDALKDLGIRQGANPDEWFGTFRPVQRWLSFEKLVDDIWIYAEARKR